LQISADWALPSEKIKSNDKWLALALYKEGKNSSSVFYAFLNYWKILELGIPDEKSRYVWVEANVDKLQDGKAWGEYVLQTDNSIREYLERSCRDALAHARMDPTVDPDDYEDKSRIRRDADALHDLARHLIESGILDQPRRPRPKGNRRRRTKG
jgi:hypothetical protein